MKHDPYPQEFLITKRGLRRAMLAHFKAHGLRSLKDVMAELEGDIAAKNRQAIYRQGFIG